MHTTTTTAEELAAFAERVAALLPESWKTQSARPHHRVFDWKSVPATEPEAFLSNGCELLQIFCKRPDRYTVLGIDTASFTIAHMPELSRVTVAVRRGPGPLSRAITDRLLPGYRVALAKRQREMEQVVLRQRAAQACAAELAAAYPGGRIMREHFRTAIAWRLDDDAQSAWPFAMFPVGDTVSIGINTSQPALTARVAVTLAQIPPKALPLVRARIDELYREVATFTDPAPAI